MNCACVKKEDKGMKGGELKCVRVIYVICMCGV